MSTELASCEHFLDHSSKGVALAEKDRYTLSEANLAFAKKIHGEVWVLLEKTDRSELDDELMVHAAHASCYHWLHVGRGLNHQRGEWLISRVYAVLNKPGAALRHAKRCLDLTSEHDDLIEDFDLAFAYECVARANAVAVNQEEAIKYIQLAKEAGDNIKDEGDRRIFFNDFNGGEWYGLR